MKSGELNRREKKREERRERGVECGAYRLKRSEEGEETSVLL